MVHKTYKNGRKLPTKKYIRMECTIRFVEVLVVVIIKLYFTIKHKQYTKIIYIKNTNIQKLQDQNSINIDSSYISPS